MGNRHIHGFGGDYVEGYKAGRDINFGSVRNAEELVSVLEKVRESLAAAQKQGQIDVSTASRVDKHAAEAISEVKGGKPDPKSLIGHLKEMRDVLEGASNVGKMVAELVPVITSGIQVARSLFGL